MSKKLTTEEYQIRISEINPNLKIISGYNMAKPKEFVYARVLKRLNHI